MTKIHFFKQHDSMECGISCLQCICAFWGKEVSVNQLSKKCVMTTEGVFFLVNCRNFKIYWVKNT